MDDQRRSQQIAPDGATSHTQFKSTVSLLKYCAGLCVQEQTDYYKTSVSMLISLSMHNSRILINMILFILI